MVILALLHNTWWPLGNLLNLQEVSAEGTALHSGCHYDWNESAQCSDWAVSVKRCPLDHRLPRHLGLSHGLVCDLAPYAVSFKWLPCFTFSFDWFYFSETILSLASMRKLELTKRHQLHFQGSFGVLIYSAACSVLLYLAEGQGSDPGQHVFLSLCWYSIKHEKNLFTETFLLYVLIPGGDGGAARIWHTSAPLNIS